MNILQSMLTLTAGKRTKWVVLVLWLVVAGVAGPFAGKLQGAEKNDQVSFLPSNAQSTQVIELQKQFAGSRVTPAVVVFRRASGLRPADRVRATADGRALERARIRGIETVPPPIASRDRRALLLVVPVTANDDVTVLSGAVDAIRRQVGPGGDGLDIKVTGPAGFSADAIKVFASIDTKLLLTTVLLVAVLLLLIYRSPFLWLLPLITLGFAESLAQSGAYAMARAGFVVNGQTSGLMTILVFGAGTDYALLLVARYREELRRHEDRHDAMRYALQQAGPSIVASGGTVALALLSLLAAELNNNRGLGPIGAIGIACALLAMLTLLPALLLVLGRGVFWPSIPRFGSASHEGSGNFARIGRRIAPHPRRVWVATLGGLLVLALGLTQTSFGLNSLNGFRSTTDSVLGQRLVDESFPAGISASTTVVVRALQAVETARAAALRTAGVGSVGPVQRSGTLARFSVVLTAPPYGDAAFSDIGRLRSRLHSVVGSAALVGGPTAEELDTRIASVRDAMVIVPVVLLVVLVVLMALLRAVIAPLILIGTVIVSFAAALGLSVTVFRWLFNFPGADPSLPLLSFIFLVALGVDYNIFLMARTREEAERVGTWPGMLTALAVTGGVITSAGIVLAGTFAVLGVLPLVALTEIGFVVAFGVLLDTLVVRTILVPALTLDIGSAIWWPSALARRDDSMPGGPSLHVVSRDDLRRFGN